MVGSTDSVWLQDHTWQDVKMYIEETEDPTVIVPIGSTEQHGPHLPLGVDAFQAIEVAEGIGQQCSVLIAPPIWYGDAAHHMYFPGTISLSSETVISLLKDVYESLISHGVTNIITVNGHRLANLPVIEIAAKQTKENHPGTFFATIDLVRIGVRIHNELREGDPEDGMHGGEFESSFLMFKYPELVREEKIEREVHERWTRFSSYDFVNMDDTVPIMNASHDWTTDDLGHYGDPTKGSAEKGEELYKAIVDNGVEFINDLREFRENQRQEDNSASDV